MNLLEPSDTATKTTRRLVPQFSLTKQDLGSENGRARTSAETLKKPGMKDASATCDFKLQ